MSVSLTVPLTWLASIDLKWYINLYFASEVFTTVYDLRLQIVSFHDFRVFAVCDVTAQQ